MTCKKRAGGCTKPARNLMRKHTVGDQLAVCLFIGALAALGAAQDSSLLNPSFELDKNGDGTPDDWKTSGNAQVVQTLTRIPARNGGFAAQLRCTAFVGGRPDSHAMLCQTGSVGCRRGQWYRLSLWLKGDGSRHGLVQVALRNTKPWANSGIGGAFPVTPAWRRVERLCQASADVPAATSRFQIWFASTGTLCVDDVRLTPTTVETHLHPTLSMEGVHNYFPNSSFECGTSGWGSYDPNIRAWGNVFRLIGNPDDTVARHGHVSLRIQVRKSGASSFSFDYFTPVQQTVGCSLAVPKWWVPVTPGKKYVLSAWVRADRPKVPVLLLAHFGNGRNSSFRDEAGREWSRIEHAFTAADKYLWAGAGPNLRDASLPEATVWLDALQLEAGTTATAYAPRTPVESTLSSPALGNIFTDPKEGLTLTVSAANASDLKAEVRGYLRILDFQDREVLKRQVRVPVAAGARGSSTLRNLLPGRTGFYRAIWRPADAPKTPEAVLRCALIPKYTASDSPFGMNHAYPMAFMLRLARIGGLTWMRDWSVKWHTVQPVSGPFNFSVPDAQINRVLVEGLQTLVLFPFPSTPWNTQADEKKIAAEAKGKTYLLDRYRVACAPKDENAFAAYIRAGVQHYGVRVSSFEVLNEPVYTTYAVPQRFGYTVADYVSLLKVAYTSAKRVKPSARVIGGIAAWADSRHVRDFIKADGLRWVDAMNVHLYPNTVSPEVFAADLQDVRELMRRRGELRPIWLTEFGCYADDDPWRTPRPTIGDATMSRSNWPSEQEASEALVKTAAVFLGNGIEKIFFHAGTSGVVNGRAGSGVFFEYGGAPRKMYAALAILSAKLGPKPEPVLFQNDKTGLIASVFRTRRGGLAVVWGKAGGKLRLPLPAGVGATDTMGNPIAGPVVECGASPVYLDAGHARAIVQAVSGVRTKE